jgi:hypothetical protein
MSFPGKALPLKKRIKNEGTENSLEYNETLTITETVYQRRRYNEKIDTNFSCFISFAFSNINNTSARDI